MTTQRLPKINYLLEADFFIKLSQVVSEALEILESTFSRKSCTGVAQFAVGFTL